MTFDIVAPTLLALLTAAIAGVGIEMVNNPPTELKHKRIYRTIFWVLALATVTLQLSLSVHTESLRLSTETKAVQDRLQDRGDLQYMRGKLDVISDLLLKYANSPQSNFSDLARALASIAKAAVARPSSSTPKDSSPLQSSNQYAALSNADLGTLMAGFAHRLMLYQGESRQKEDYLIKTRTMTGQTHMKDWSAEQHRQFEEKSRQDQLNLIASINDGYRSGYQQQAVALRDEALRRLGATKLKVPLPEPVDLNAQQVGGEQIYKIASYLDSLGGVLSSN